jgi:hypothetical protein
MTHAITRDCTQAEAVATAEATATPRLPITDDRENQAAIRITRIRRGRSDQSNLGSVDLSQMARAYETLIALSSAVSRLPSPTKSVAEQTSVPKKEDTAPQP